MTQEIEADLVARLTEQGASNWRRSGVDARTASLKWIAERRTGRGRAKATKQIAVLVEKAPLATLRPAPKPASGAAARGGR